MIENVTVETLKEFKPKHEYFIGIDSDGCAFDSMEIKHKECFIPNIIKHWKLQPVSNFARQAAEFVNLYSKWRGINRWPALMMVFDLLSEREDVKRRGVEMPDVKVLRDWIENETRLSNTVLKEVVDNTGDAVLKQAYIWSEAVNKTIEDMVENVPPFPNLRESLTKMDSVADIFVVSQTPTEALTREWKEHSIDSYVEFICGQEMGTKTEHIQFIAGGKYPTDKMLMIGDAPGDMKAAHANKALFYPINPGNEEQSWKRFHDEAFDKFINGQYAGDYEAKVIAEFEGYLPSTPPWKK
ncbi:MAG: HAD family hydrolase [Phycisphaerae bacterium]|nr:HAD family hydrolase [Phycisphaerae bacterium]